MTAIIYDSKTGKPKRTVSGNLEPVVETVMERDDEEILTGISEEIAPRNFNKYRVKDGELLFDISLDTAKSKKIQEIKERAKNILTKTDWYIVREQETNKSVPKEVLNHRSKVRSLSGQFESEVNALSAISEVQDYRYSYPDPPEP